MGQEREKREKSGEEREREREREGKRGKREKERERKEKRGRREYERERERRASYMMIQKIKLDSAWHLPGSSPNLEHDRLCGKSDLTLKSICFQL